MAKGETRIGGGFFWRRLIELNLVRFSFCLVRATQVLAFTNFLFVKGFVADLMPFNQKMLGLHLSGALPTG